MKKGYRYVLIALGLLVLLMVYAWLSSRPAPMPPTVGNAGPARPPAPLNSPRQESAPDRPAGTPGAHPERPDGRP